MASGPYQNIEALPLSGIHTIDELSEAINVSFRELQHVRYAIPKRHRYSAHSILKRDGLERIIKMPHPKLKEIQRALLPLLYRTYKNRPGVHGYVKNCSAITNARQHERERYVLNIDLVGFFQAISFRRVKDLLQSEAYAVNDILAAAIAELCCHDGSLPQGAPTSPIISNMVCGPMDAELRALANKYNSTYTRYSDDISISCSDGSFPSAIATVQRATRTVVIGQELGALISRHDFEINHRKSRLLSKSDRQEVTGLVTNEFLNVPRTFIKNIRASLHCCEKHGFDAASDLFDSRYCRRRGGTNFATSLLGKIQYVGQVRGWSDPLYLKLRDQYSSLLLPQNKLRVPFS